MEKSGRIRWKISILPKPEKLWLKDEDRGGGGVVGKAGGSCDWELRKSQQEEILEESLA